MERSDREILSVVLQEYGLTKEGEEVTLPFVVYWDDGEMEVVAKTINEGVLFSLLVENDMSLESGPWENNEDTLPDEEYPLLGYDFISGCPDCTEDRLCPVHR